MAGYISPKQRDAKEELIICLRTHIRHTGGVSEAARKIKMSENDLSKVLRLERAVSLSKIFHMGEALGLRLSMRWVNPKAHWERDRHG